jgi:hypothetical protein
MLKARRDPLRPQPHLVAPRAPYVCVEQRSRSNLRGRTVHTIIGHRCSSSRTRTRHKSPRDWHHTVTVQHGVYEMSIESIQRRGGGVYVGVRGTSNKCALVRCIREHTRCVQTGEVSQIQAYTSATRCAVCTHVHIYACCVDPFLLHVLQMMTCFVVWYTLRD